MKNSEKRLKLYKKSLRLIRDKIGLGHWQVFLVCQDLSEYSASAINDSIDFSHFMTTIKIEQAFIENEPPQGQDNFREIFEILLHEMCHVYTGAGSGHLETDKEDFEYSMGKAQYNHHRNFIIAYEEQLTNTLDRVLFNVIKDTKEYKELEKEFNQI